MTMIWFSRTLVVEKIVVGRIAVDETRVVVNSFAKFDKMEINVDEMLDAEMKKNCNFQW